MRVTLSTALLFVSGLAWVAPAGLSQSPPARLDVVQVYKSPTCQCCAKWVEHLRQHGLTVTTTDVDDLGAVKAEHKVPGNLKSCHTAVVGRYVVEGHVPAVDVLRLLKERPAVAGVAVPRMPVGSPGMEGPKPEAYDVLTFTTRGDVGVFASHRP